MYDSTSNHLLLTGIFIHYAKQKITLDFSIFPIGKQSPKSKIQLSSIYLLSMSSWIMQKPSNKLSPYYIYSTASREMCMKWNSSHLTTCRFTSTASLMKANQSSFHHDTQHFTKGSLNLKSPSYPLSHTAKWANFLC